MSDTDSKKICKSIFKNGKSTTSKDNFTKAWISLINQLEKTNAVTLREPAYCSNRYQASPATPVFNNKSVERKR